MHLISTVLLVLLAIEHFYIMWLEMFSWTKAGKKAFKGAMEPEMFEKTKTLAANQGLYNGFLAAGLLWAAFIPDHHWKLYVGVFFCTCVLVAGLYGGATASKKIYFVQALPALITLIVLHL